jgi:hypothetical protein
MQQYSGLSRHVQVMKDRFEGWITRNGTPPVGSRAFEARLEMDKLPHIIQERANRLAQGGLDKDSQAKLELELADLKQRLATHERNYRAMDKDPGVGFVAASDRKITVGGQEMQAEDLLLQGRDIANNIASRPRYQQQATGILATETPGTRPSKSPKGKPVNVTSYDVKPTDELPSVVAASEQMPRRGLFQEEQLNFSEPQGNTSVPVQRRQFFGGPNNKLVYEVDENGLPITTGIDYKSLGQDLGQLGTGEKVSGAIQRWIQTRTVPDGINPNPIAAFGTLTGVQEVLRNPATIMTLPMVLDIARGGNRGKGARSFEEALDLFPMAPPKAVPNNKALNEYLERYRQAREQGLEDPPIPIAAEKALNAEADLYDA